MATLNHVITTDINVHGQKPEAVQQSTYLGSTIINEGSKPDILSTAAKTTSALSRLNPVWKENISMKHQTRLQSAWVCSIFLHACEIWTLAVELERIQATKSYAIAKY